MVKLNRPLSDVFTGAKVSLTQAGDKTRPSYDKTRPSYKGSSPVWDEEEGICGDKEEVRREYAVKVWSLLAMQLNVSFLLAVIFEFGAPEIPDVTKRVYLWIGSATFTLAILLILRCVRKKTPYNYIMLFVATIVTGCFWGTTKYVANNFFSINLTGQITLSLTLSALLHYTKITENLAAKMEPATVTIKSPKVQSVVPTGGKPTNAWNDSDKPVKVHSKPMGPEGSKTSRTSRASVAVTRAIINQTIKNDGMLRATMVLGMGTWLFAALFNVGFIYVLSKQTSLAISEDANVSVAAFAALLSFFLLLFFHYDCERWMRKCQVDEYLEVVIEINSDLTLALVLAYTLAMILACNAQSLEMREGFDGGVGGGGGGGDMGGGGMEGGAGDAGGGADAGGAGGADAPPPEEDIDAVVGGDGV